MPTTRIARSPQTGQSKTKKATTVGVVVSDCDRVRQPTANEQHHQRPSGKWEERWTMSLHSPTNIASATMTGPIGNLTLLLIPSPSSGMRIRSWLLSVIAPSSVDSKEGSSRLVHVDGERENDRRLRRRCCEFESAGVRSYADAKR